mgnify:CR=1 FL=1
MLTTFTNHPSPLKLDKLPPRLTPLPLLFKAPHAEDSTVTGHHLVEGQLSHDSTPHALGQGGYGLGIGWERLHVLVIAHLSQAGVRLLSRLKDTIQYAEVQAKTMTTHLNLLAGHPTLLQRLSISTNFLDVPMLSAIGNLGALGQLRHLELATGGTKLTAEGLSEVLGGCRNLESLCLNDVQGQWTGTCLLSC